MGGRTVSVIIASYNAEKTIARALDSVRAQTAPAHEIVVVDDASNDRTAEIVAAQRDLPIKLIQLDSNMGPSAARNAGLDTASGDLVAFLDSDDEWLPTKLEQQTSLFEADSACAIAGARGIWVADGQAAETIPCGEPWTGPDGWKQLLWANWFHTSYVMTWRRLAVAARFDPRLVVAEDWDLWIRLARAGNVAFCPSVLARLHRTPGSFMRSNLARVQPDLLSVIESSVARYQRDLTPAERRLAYASAYRTAGQVMLRNGQARSGLRYLLKAIQNRANPAEVSWFIAKTFARSILNRSGARR
jgi:glycosyltransferase involved in cell wall biosynthesis